MAWTRSVLRTRLIGLAALVAMTLAGCAYNYLVYKPTGMPAYPKWADSDGIGAAAGYSETRIADDQYVVDYKGVGGGLQSFIAPTQDLARLRAAHITLDQGYTHFVILDDDLANDPYQYANGVVAFTEPRVELKIKLLKPPNDSVPNALDAKSIIASLGPKYDTYVAATVQKIRESAENGDADAQSDLGYFYDRGYGVPQDYAQAAQWHRKAAEQGNAYSQYALGVYYEYGHGVPQDKNQAIQWYRAAAKQGNFDAQQKIDSLVFGK